MKEEERLAKMQSVAEARRIRLELREEQKKRTKDVVEKRNIRAKELRQEKREKTQKEFEKWQLYREQVRTRKIAALEGQAQSGEWMSLDKEERDAQIDRAFGKRARWDSWMQFVEKANSKRETRLTSKNLIKTGYVRWEEGKQ
eukprot:g1188.t1